MDKERLGGHEETEDALGVDFTVDERARIGLASLDLAAVSTPRKKHV
jgi:hypothetical protein